MSSVGSGTGAMLSTPSLADRVRVTAAAQKDVTVAPADAAVNPMLLGTHVADVRRVHLALRAAKGVNFVTAPRPPTASSAMSEQANVVVSQASLGGAAISVCKATGTTARMAVRRVTARKMVQRRVTRKLASVSACQV